MKICKKLLKAIKSKEFPISYNEVYREFGISVLDGGSSIIVISYCPYCGQKLPVQLRNKWFKELEKLGFQDPLIEEIPTEFRSDKWWKERKL